MYLNKLAVIGHITDHTPRCVLEDVLYSSGFDCSDPDLTVDDIIQQIYLIPSVVVTSTQDYGKLATFINRKCDKWKPTGLKKAYHHLTTFNPLHFNESKSIFGYKTQDQYNNIDICLAYKLCVFHSLPLHRNTTYNEMITMIKRMNLEPTFDNLSRIYQTLKRKEYYQTSFPTDCHIILHAALGFGINISSSKQLTEEYQTLCRYRNTLSKWEPQDAEFRKHYQFNPILFDIYKFWSPKFNFLYDDYTLQIFAEKEGYSSASLEGISRTDLEHHLQLARVTPTFYAGRLPNATKHTTISMTDITELDNEDCVTFGMYDDEFGSLGTSKSYVYTYEELWAWFRDQKKFTIPETPRTTFSDLNIAKLKNILRASSSEISNTLEREIDSIEEYYRNYSIEERTFSEKYMNKPLMIECLRKCLDLGMYMRGWTVTTGVESYPLTAEQSSFENDQYEKVETLVQDKFLEFSQFLEDHPDIYEDFIHIPLFIMREGQIGTYERNTDPKQGLTLYERLKIVSTGSVKDSVYSCIRMSSNWIVASAYKYLCLLSQPVTFQIKDLRYIS